MHKLLIAVVLGAAVLVWPQSASAHVLLRDTSSKTGALLHSTPDDDPIAGAPASLFFDIQDSRLKAVNASSRLLVTDEQHAAVVVPTKLLGNSVTAEYIFPRQGLYRLELIVTEQGKVTYRFEQSQRVSRGIGSSVSPSPPAWADIGTIVTATALVGTAIVAYNRRREISSYSKV